MKMLRSEIVRRYSCYDAGKEQKSLRCDARGALLQVRSRNESVHRRKTVSQCVRSTRTPKISANLAIPMAGQLEQTNIVPQSSIESAPSCCCSLLVWSHRVHHACGIGEMEARRRATDSKQRCSGAWRPLLLFPAENYSVQVFTHKPKQCSQTPDRPWPENNRHRKEFASMLLRLTESFSGD